MSHESFDPSKYKNVAEMPKDQQENFEAIPTAPDAPEEFVKKSALQIQARFEEDAQKINELRSGIKKLFGKGKIDSDDSMRAEADIEDRERMQRTSPGLNSPVVAKNVQYEMENRYSRIKNESEQRESIGERIKSGFKTWLRGEGGSSSRSSSTSSFLPSNEDVAKGLEQAKKRNPFF